MTEIIEKRLYDGDIVLHFYPNSHQYKIAEIQGEKLKKKHSVPGVTSFTGMLDKSNALMGWAVKQYSQRMDELLEEGSYTREDVVRLMELAQDHYKETKQKAADVGTYVHKFCEEYAKQLSGINAYNTVVEELGVPPDEMKAKIDEGVQGFVRWVEKEHVQIISAEQLVFSRKFVYAGLYDAIMQYRGGRFLVDYKTSNGIYNEHYYQLSAYVKAYEEESGNVLDGGMIIAIAKEDTDKKKAGEITLEIRNRDDIESDYKAFLGFIPIKNREKELQAQWRKKNAKV